jgi:hypothetical protein
MNTNLKRVVDLMRVVGEIQLKGGLSYNLNTGELNPPSGYMVASPCCEERSPVLDEQTIRSYIEQHTLSLANENNFLGVWFDTVSKQFVFDVSRHYSERTQAAVDSLLSNQKAIWDCTNQKEIRINPRRALTVYV